MRIISVLFVLLLSGCAVVPENIQIADETQLVSYEQVIANGESAHTKPARWGGLIAGVENMDGNTLVEVVHFPLNHYGKPSVNNESVGRFKVKMDGFLDPVVFENGRSITFTGSIDTPVEGAVGEQPYIYPLIAGESYHLWRKQRVYDVQTTQFNQLGWGGPFIGGGLWHPRGFGFGPWGGWGGWGPWGAGFQQSRVRVVERAPKSNPNTKAYYGNKVEQTKPLSSGSRNDNFKTKEQ